MAAVTFTVFEEFSKDLANGVHNLGSDTLNIALLKAAAAPTAATATPRYADFSANECSGTGYSGGGQAVDNNTIAEVGGVTTLDFDDETFAYNAAGPTDAKYALLFNDTASNDEAIGFWTFDVALSMRNGNIVVGPNASGCITITVS